MGSKSSKVSATPVTHTICRPGEQFTYSKEGDAEIIRPAVPDDKLHWKEDYPEYAPVEYTSSSVLNNPSWADPVNPWQIFNWNKITETDRRSHMGSYNVVHGRPQNPVGRTGIAGRGKLGKWGPNHAVDPIVTRWKMDDKGKKVKHPETKKFILQFVAIQRSDTGEWAIPGGMVDAGETVSNTLKREFMEETNPAATPSADKKNKEVAKQFDTFFKKGKEIYKGYCDDPRNTDHAWMETVVHSFHDASNKIFKNFKLKAGDDAANVAWMDVNSDLSLYAMHKHFIELAAKKYKAHWKYVPKPVKVKKEKTPKAKKDTKDKKKDEEKTEEVKEEPKKAEEKIEATEVEEVKDVVEEVKDAAKEVEVEGESKP